MRLIAPRSWHVDRRVTRSRFWKRVYWCAVMLLVLWLSGGLAGQTAGIPWGAMYVPLESMQAYGMTGTVGYYRGPQSVPGLLSDLELARHQRLKLIVTLGNVRPSSYADDRGNLDLARVREELAPFLAAADELRPYVESGTIWGLRFLDEPHDPSGLPRGVIVNPQHLGEVMALLQTSFGGVRVGSTSPASYMVQVPHAGWCTGGYHHDLLRRRGLDPLEHLRQDSALAVQHGLRYVANLNACTNPLDNRTFFEVYLALARLPDVHFLTSWQWEQGRYPQPSFEQRLRDPQVQDLVRSLPRVIAELTTGREVASTLLATHGLRYRLEVRADPRPLRLHVLEIDLGAPHIEVAAALTPDPDGEGPAEGALESPLALAQRTGALALVNANPWRSLPDAAGHLSSQWVPGMAVDILGLVKSDEVLRSPAEPGYCAVWIDDQARAHIGQPGLGNIVRAGLAGFSQVLKDGEVLVEPDTVCHPRTGLGVDATGKKLLLVVVDGRQPGFSEGMTLHELGSFLLAQGCRDGVNLDGGGSSILILADDRGQPQVVSSPSTQIAGLSLPRPLPVALIVRSKE